jgi:hypothetical protein
MTSCSSQVSDPNHEKCKRRAKSPKHVTIQRKLFYTKTLCILMSAGLDWRRLRFLNIGGPE